MVIKISEGVHYRINCLILDQGQCSEPRGNNFEARFIVNNRAQINQYCIENDYLTPKGNRINYGKTQSVGRPVKKKKNKWKLIIFTTFTGKCPFKLCLRNIMCFIQFYLTSPLSPQVPTQTCFNSYHSKNITLASQLQIHFFNFTGKWNKDTTESLSSIHLLP